MLQGRGIFNVDNYLQNVGSDVILQNIRTLCIYIYATPPPEPMFQKMRPCLKAYCHVAMIWAKKTAGAVDDTAKMMSSSPKQNDMLFSCSDQYPKVNWQGGLW